MRTLVLLTSILLLSSALADDAPNAAAFNAAWEDYKVALESGSDAAVIETSRLLVEIGEQVIPESDERLALILQKHGQALSLGRYKAREQEVLRRSLDLMEGIYGSNSIRLVPIIADLADAHSDLHDESEQLRHYRRAMNIVKGEHGKHSLEYADIAFRAATRTFEHSRSNAGKKFLRDAYAIYAAELGPKHQKAGLSLFFLGKMEFSARRLRNAAALLVDALPAFDTESEVALQYRLVTRALLVQVYEFAGKSERATEHCVAIGRESQLSAGQDFVPIFRVAPTYPRQLLASRTEGYVDLKFTVTEAGFVENAEVINVVLSKGGGTKPSTDERSTFDAAALDAVRRFRYAPKFEDGVAVPVENVKARISFKIEK